MSVSPDFEIEPPPSSDGDDASGSKPIVVIQYRNRGLSAALVPPLVILLAALVISSYRRETPLRLRTSARAAASPVVAEGGGRTILVEAPETGSVIAPIELRTEGADSPQPAVASAVKTDPAPREAETPRAAVAAAEPAAAPPKVDPPAETARPSPPAEDEVPAPDKPREIAVAPPADDPAEPSQPVEHQALASAERPAIGFDPNPSPEPPPEPPPTDPPPRSKDEIMEEIRTEAAEKQAEQEHLEDLKGNVRLLQIREAWLKAQQDRYKFHVELSRLLRKRGDDAGPDIDALCDRFGRETLPEIRKTVRTQLKRASGGQSRQATIDMMRRYGYPEPLILEYLANKLHNFMHTRNGPRDSDEVMVLAARALLSCPVAPPTRRDSSSASSASASNLRAGTAPVRVPPGQP